MVLIFVQTISEDSEYSENFFEQLALIFSCQALISHKVDDSKAHNRSLKIKFGKLSFNGHFKNEVYLIHLLAWFFSSSLNQFVSKL